MTIIQIIVLAIVQGLTEFLPISSSGHLILAPALLGWSDQGVAFDVAVHFGTLAGVVGYFRRDIGATAYGVFDLVRGRPETADGHLGILVIVATVPVGLVGILAHDWISTELRSPLVIALATAVFGVLLLAADLLGRRVSKVSDLSLGGALFVGSMQALALIPGTSRSGITMTAGLILGLTRREAARFSFMLSVPVIVLAAGLETFKLITQQLPVDWNELVIATGISAIVAYVTVGLFLRFVEALGMAPFVIYRLFLAGVIWYALL